MEDGTVAVLSGEMPSVIESAAFIAELRDKTEAMPRIRYNGAPICEIDARQPYEQVLASALNAIERAAPTA